MNHRIPLLLFFSFLFSIVSAQRFSNFAKVHYVQFTTKKTNKQIEMVGYELGVRRICYNISGGIGTGSDNEFLPVDKMNDGKYSQEVHKSQTIFPSIYPSDSYLESVNSTYKIKQLRMGFTVFLRRNDTLDRHPFTGPHCGVEAMFCRTTEFQTATYKSNSDETRFSYSATHQFNAIGAATHIGWQFALLNDHLFIDLRGVIPFYFPLMAEPNLNSPFAGNKWEIQGSIGWHFYRTKNSDAKDSDKDKVRDKI
jgi:hypothetical protein